VNISYELAKQRKSEGEKVGRNEEEKVGIGRDLVLSTASSCATLSLIYTISAACASLPSSALVRSPLPAFPSVQSSSSFSLSSTSPRGALRARMRMSQATKRRTTTRSLAQLPSSTFTNLFLPFLPSKSRVQVQRAFLGHCCSFSSRCTSALHSAVGSQAVSQRSPRLF
jgi:hypothetical protein